MISNLRAGNTKSCRNRWNLSIGARKPTVIVRVIAQAGVVAHAGVIAQRGVIVHAGVIAPLCVIFSSLESINSFSPQGSESSRRGAMTPISVPLSNVRLHPVACGLRIKFVPRTLAFAFFLSATAPKKYKKKAPPALPRCGADLPRTAVPHGTERRQPTTQYLPTYDTPPFRRFSSLRRQHHKPTRILPSPVVALNLLHLQNKAPNAFVCTGRDHLPRAVPTGTSNIPTVPG